MESGIYSIDINGIEYIGSAKNFAVRFKRHLRGLKSGNHHNIILQRAFNKCGLDKLKFFIVEEIPYKKKIILEREQFHIDKAKKKGRCANLSGASFGDTKTGHPNRDIIIDKMSKSIRLLMKHLGAEGRKEKYGRSGELNGMHGKTHSEEVKIKLKTYERSDETREKMSISALKKFEDAPYLKKNISEHASLRTGEKNPFFGKKHSEETKKKISKTNKGSIPPNRIAIKINGKPYESYGHASKELNIPVTTIRWRCMSKNKKFDNYERLQISSDY